MLVLLTTPIAVYNCSTSSNLTSHNSLSNTTDQDEEKGTKPGRILSQRLRPETKESWYSPTYLFGIRRDMDIERTSDERESRKTKNTEHELKSFDIRGGKITKKILDQQDGHESVKETHDVTDIHSVRSYIKLQKMSEQPRNSETKYVAYNWTDSVSGTRKYTVLKRIISDQQRRLENKGNSTSKGDTKRDTKLNRIWNRREAPGTKYIGYESTIPDGFQHYYVPASSVANFIIGYIVRPKHMRCFQQAYNVSACLKYKLKNLDLKTLNAIQQCFDVLTKEILIPDWMIHLVGFVILCCILLLAAFFMLMLCPCLMCWQISFQRVVQAGKLDTYSNVSWAMITLFSCSSIVFALLGVVSVGCAGIGMGYYLKSGGQTMRISIAYEEVQTIVFNAMKENTYTNFLKNNKLKVAYFDTVSPQLYCLISQLTAGYWQNGWLVGWLVSRVCLSRVSLSALGLPISPEWVVRSTSFLACDAWPSAACVACVACVPCVARPACARRGAPAPSV